MRTHTPDTVSYLTDHGIKPSMQRMAVMGYLMAHRTHPTAEEIYSALHVSMPTLSKTTVYNTLKLFTELGAAKQLTIDERNVCFDYDTSDHAHFLCKDCGKVFDIAIDKEKFRELTVLPEGFESEHAALYFRGRCKRCSAKRKRSAQC
ncbi:MAG: Fur family transcriptional regulator [Alloprevotella sp.]